MIADNKIIRVCCHNNVTSLELLRLMGYSIYGSQVACNYMLINIWTKEASPSYRQQGLILYPQDLEIMALLPTIDSIEQYIYTRQGENLCQQKLRAD